MMADEAKEMQEILIVSRKIGASMFANAAAEKGYIHTLAAAQIMKEIEATLDDVV